ncbi:MAG TPA: ribbon-helix-helix domain-containing protein [Armatimonadota bacterium]|nr:ribbon-helix-helix domain-containing protein [Armatimonadota bacterium]
MAQRPKLALGPNVPVPERVEAHGTPRGKTEARPDRAGKKAIAGYFPRETWVALRSLSIQQDKTTQDLMQEAFDDLFAKYRSRV